MSGLAVRSNGLRAAPLAAHVVSNMCAVRKAKAEATFPRPTAGALRPIVHGQTLRYQAKRRSGRGFTHEELKVRRKSLCTGGGTHLEMTRSKLLCTL